MFSRDCKISKNIFFIEHLRWLLLLFFNLTYFEKEIFPQFFWSFFPFAVRHLYYIKPIKALEKYSYFIDA